MGVLGGLLRSHWLCSRQRFTLPTLHCKHFSLYHFDDLQCPVYLVDYGAPATLLRARWRAVLSGNILSRLEVVSTPAPLAVIRLFGFEL